MDRKKLAMIKYDHGEPVGLSGARWMWLLLVVAVAVGALFVFIPLSFILGIVALVIIRQPRRLYVGPRYLICGGKILYYANIQKLILEADRGLLTLESSTGKVLVLEQDKFHTGARKPEKIVANKEARFEKVARKIVRHVLRASPQAELKGVLKLLASGP